MNMSDNHATVVKY